MELSNTEAELASTDLSVWFHLRFIVCPQWEAVKRRWDFLKCKDFLSNVAERKSLFFCLWEQFEAQKAETPMWSKTDGQVSLPLNKQY